MDTRDRQGGREAPPEPRAVGRAEPAEAPVEPEQGFIRELSQFFVVPSLIVLLCVGIFIMFGLVSSDAKSPREFLQQVRTSRGSDRWQAAYELSRAIAQQPRLGEDRKLVEEIVSMLRDEGREDPQVRRYLIIALEHLGNRSAGPAIIESLSDPDPEVRLQAARALGVLESVPGAAPALVGLLSDESPDIRKVAIFALGQTRDPAAIPALLPKLEDPAEDIRWNAALALAVLGDPSGGPVIAQMIDREHLDTIEGITEEQKISAIINGVQAVYLLKDRSFEDKIRHVSQNDPSLKARGIAIKALEALEKGTAP